MGKGSTVTHFANFLAEALNTKCVRQTKENLYYVRCSTKRELLEELFKKLSISYRISNIKETPVSGSPRFNDSILIANYQGSDIIIKTDGSGVKQKKLAPNKLIKVGYQYTNPEELYSDVVTGLNSDDTLDKDTIQSCINILESIKTKSKLILTETLRDGKDKSKITSDFGEVALAYRRLLWQGGNILFPANSNQSDFDFYHNDIPISAKGQKGGSRYLIAGNKSLDELIDKLGNTNIEKMFKSWHKREIMDMLDYASYDCVELRYWRDKLNGKINDVNLEHYVKTNSYQKFVLDVRSCQNGNNLGVPEKENVGGNYNNGNLNPIKFALLTIWARYYVNQNLDNFNKFATILTSTSNIVFEYFDYDINTRDIKVVHSSITNYTKWDIVYHANAASSLNNYPALKGIQ